MKFDVNAEIWTDNILNLLFRLKVINIIERDVGWNKTRLRRREELV